MPKKKTKEDVQTKSVKCPSCGGNLSFNPETQTLYCEHCGGKQEIEKGETAKEIDFFNGLKEETDWSEGKTSVFTCSNCGAKVVLGENETAKKCPFCGTAYVQEKESLVGIKPNGVIPFNFGIDRALTFIKDWAKGKLFAPRKFKKSLNTENVKGVYAPCFTFDSQTFSAYYGRVGDRHTRIVGSGKNQRTETYIVWRTVSGNFSRNFNDVLISAGDKFTQKCFNKLSPFDTDNSLEFDNKYLLGFMAYHYDSGIEDCWKRAKTSMDSVIKSEIIASQYCDVVDYINVSTSHKGVTYKYLMLPVYLGNFSYNEKTYNFYVNGSTGKITGKTPVSALKVLLTVLIGVVLVGGIIALIMSKGCV